MSESAPLELLCVDQVTGAEFVCSRLAPAHRPCVFHFEHLLPNHAYDVVLLQYFTGTGSGSSTGGSKGGGRVLWGSFTTLQAQLTCLAATINNAKEDAQVVQSLRSATTGGGSVAEASAMRNSTHATNSDTVRFLLLGADKPSWRSKLATPAEPAYTHNTQSSSSAVDRLHLTRGIELCHELSHCLSQGWRGVDLVLHCGYTVDWGTCIDSVLNVLAQAEHLHGMYSGSISLHNQQYISSNNIPTTTDYNNNYTSNYQDTANNTQQNTLSLENLLLQALEQLRSSYLLHWGSVTHTSNLLAHGNHYFLHSPVSDLLTLFHASSLQDLRRDLSPYCVHYLIRFMTQLYTEYQAHITCPVHTLVAHTSSSSSTTSSGGGINGQNTIAQIPYIRYLNNGSIVLFELQPNFSYHFESLQQVHDRMIPETQRHALYKLLFSSQEKERAAPTSNALHTLVLLSPIPLVLHSEEYTKYSLLESTQRGLSYPQQEVLALLDMLAQWMAVSPLQREVLIITGGVATSFTTTITVESLHRGYNGTATRDRRHADSSSSNHRSRSPSPVPRSPSPVPFSAPQLLEDTSTTSPLPDEPGHAKSHRPLHALQLRQMCCGVSVGVHEDSFPAAEGSLLSSQNRYSFTHHCPEASAGRELIETKANKSQATMPAGVVNPSDFHPHCGLIEIPPPNTATTMHNNSTVKHESSLQLPSHSSALHLQQGGADEKSGGRITKRATLKFLTAAGLRAHYKAGWPALLPGADTAHTHSTAQHKHNATSASIDGTSNTTTAAAQYHSILAHKRLHSTVYLYNIAQNLPSYISIDNSKPSSNSEEGFVTEIKRAMDIICQQERQLFAQAYELYLRHDHFTLPIVNNINIEMFFIAITTYIRNIMQVNIRKIIKTPSSFVIRLVWEYYEKYHKNAIKSKDLEDRGYDASDHVVSEYINARMSADIEYFVQIVRYCYELQLIIEYKAYSYGLLDGAER